MRFASQLAMVSLLTVAGAAAAQITNPDALVAPQPRNPARTQQPVVGAGLQWLMEFAKPAPTGRADDLRTDARFQQMLTDDFKQPQAMWGSGTRTPQLSQVIPLFLTKYGEVTEEHNRVLTIDGCVPDFCPAHGMLWADLGAVKPLVVFVGVNWSTEGHTTDEAAADYELWVFPSRPLNADDFPLPLAESISHWDARLAAAHRGVPHVAHALIVEPDGTVQGLDPKMAGANTLPPQTDTLQPKGDTLAPKDGDAKQ